MTPTLPAAVDATAVTTANHVLDTVPGDGDTLALVSGGHDSLTAMHVVYAYPHLDLDGIIHVNTGIGIDETRQFVRTRANQLGLAYYEVGAPVSEAGYTSEYRYETEEYTHLIHTYGFPGPPAHKYMYANLKEKPLQRGLTEHYPDREVTLISGVRRHESASRMENVVPDGSQEYLGAHTVSPLVEFTGLDVRRYRRALNLPMNPVVEQLEMSGECCCGAYASRGERRMLWLFFPKMHRYLTCLEASVASAAALESGPDKQYTRWGHSQYNAHERAAMDDDNQMLLCSTCEQQAACAASKNESNSDTSPPDCPTDD